MVSGSFAKLPARFGRYQVEKLLGKGAMGAVYLALDTQLGRKVAIKIPKLSARGSEKLLKRLKTEAVAAAQIDHPSVCPVYDSGDIEGIAYIAMKFIDGPTLKENLKSQPRTPQQAVELVLHIAEGLAEAHALKIYHRDLKPDNIKLNSRGVPVIMDFGLAKLATTLRSDASMTQAGTTIGTPAYMSPEQANGRVQEIDHRSDIYALGIIFNEMLTGQWPFSGRAMELMGQKVINDPPSPLTVKPDLDPQLAGICHKMIARQPQNRYQTAQEVIAALKATGLAIRPSMSSAAMSSDSSRASHMEVPAFLPDDEPLASIARRRKEASRSSAASALALVQAATRWWTRQPAGWKWSLATTAAALLASIAIWASGILVKVKTKDGILVVKANEPGGDVFVDGEQVQVTWSNGKKTATAKIKPGQRHVEVRKDGFSVAGSTITFKEGDRELFKAALQPMNGKEQIGEQALSKNASAESGDGTEDVDRRATVQGGNWRVEGNELLQSGSGPRWSHLTFGDRSWRDYDFTVDAMRVEGGDQFALMFRFTDREFFLIPAGNPQELSCGPQHHEPGAREFEWGWNGPKYSYPIKNHAWYTARVSVRGDRIACFIGDGASETKVAELTDQRCPVGRVGLRVLWSAYRFKNIKVTAPDGKVLWEGLPDLEGSSPAGPGSESVEPVQPIAAEKKAVVSKNVVKGEDTSGRDRDAAAWVLSLGGSVGVRVNGQPRSIAADGQLPAEPFTVEWVAIANRPLVGDDLARLTGLTEVRRVDLKDCRVGDAGIAQLQKLTGLSELVLWNASVTDAGLARLESLPNLVALELHANPGIKDNGLRSLAKLTNLKHLLINYTNITDDGLANLEDLGKLEFLGLMGTSTSAAGVAHIERLPKLGGLDLAYSKVGDDALARLQRMGNLEFLNLSATAITDAGLSQLVDVPNLKTLHLWNTRITDAAVPHLVELRRLKVLGIEKTRISEEGYGRLKAAFPDGQIWWSSQKTD